MSDYCSTISYKESTSPENIRLKESLNISDLCSESGTIFEVDNNIDSVINTSGVSYGAQLETLLTPSQLNACFGLQDKDLQDNSFSDEEDLEPFEKLARNMEDISGDGGVLKMELSPGVGSDVPLGSRVLFHYSAYLEYADEPFDSSLLRNKPQRSLLKDNDTVAGLKVGLRTMRRREKARFLISSCYAFGKMGCPPRIPPDASILYEVTLLDAIDNSAAEDFEKLDWQQQKDASFQDKISAATSYHRQGNLHYRGGRLTKAKNCYRRSSWILEAMSVKDEEEEGKQGLLLFKMYNNLAQVNLDLKEPGKACTSCHLAFGVPVKTDDGLRAKLYFRYAKAKMLLTDYPTARKYFQRAQRLKPNNHDVSTMLETLTKKEFLHRQREKVMCQRMFDMSLKVDPPATVEDEVDPALQELLSAQIRTFAAEKVLKEMPLAPTLSASELRFVTREAREVGLEVTRWHSEGQVVLKVVRG